MDKHGLTPEQLAKERPGIIYLWDKPSPVLGSSRPEWL
jgi:hypothetical protein